MKNPVTITAVVGTYRKGGIIDTAVDEVLASAKEAGADVSKVYLTDRHIEFCRNCRSCTQEAGPKRGKCVLNDEMGGLLDTLERSDGIVLASPMNFGTVTAVTKRFIERLICYGYWPWGANTPQARNKACTRRAVLVTSSAAPSMIASLTSQIVKLLKSAATLLGAKPVGVLSIGLAAKQERQDLDRRHRLRARELGKALAGE